MVTEITCSGERVVLGGSDVPPLPPTPEIPISGKKRKLFEKGSSIRPDPEGVPRLQDLITSQQYQALGELAALYKTTLVFDPDHRVDLGEVPLLSI